MTVEEVKREAAGDKKEKLNDEKPQEKKKGIEKKEELTEEDRKLQEELNMLVQRLTEPNQDLYPSALESLRTIIRSSTTSMTSVPKPLKFMRSHYLTMIEVYKNIVDQDVKRLCADIVSVLAMTSALEQSRDCLRYRLLGSKEAISSWGHEYVRHLAAEIAEEWNGLDKSDPNFKNQTEKLLKLVHEIVPYHMKHNAEAEACDLLMEIERLDLLSQYVDSENQSRVCLYLTSCVPYLPDEENQKVLDVAKEIYQKFGKTIEALRCTIMMNNTSEINRIFSGCKDLIVQKQMAFLLGRHQIFLELNEDLPYVSDLIELMSNSSLSQYFLTLARELDIMEPKMPDEVYKAHLEPSRGGFGTGPGDSARQNIAATFTNGFVNVGFCSDKLLGEDANKWFYKNKDIGMMIAAASIGLIYRWNLDTGLSALDKYLYVTEDYIKAGSLLAVGVISNGVYHDCDPASALLSDYVRSDKTIFRIGSIFGLGLAYANSKRESVKKNIIPMLLEVLQDPKANSEVLGITALSLGFICVGTGSNEVAMAIWTALSEKTEADLKDPNMRFMALGVALVYFGKQQMADVIVESMKALPEPYGSMASTVVEIAAYVGTGNVLKIQRLLHICSEHYEDSKPDEKKKEKEVKKEEKSSSTAAPTKTNFSAQQAVAVLGVALIAMGEDIGSNMSFRLFGHLLRYGEPVIKRAVPLALGLTSVSNPQLNIMETLSKFSHDADAETAYNSIFALGLIGAGTNNARLGAMLRQLAAYHARDPQHLMLVRIAQGMVHMGKGTMSLNPFHSDRQLMNPSALAGIFATCFAFLDSKNSILGKQTYLLYCMVPAIQPRMLITFEPTDSQESHLKQVNVNVRVGQAVDVVGQAGKPKTITGFQTSTTPVLLAYGERAELAVDDYVSVSPVMEGFVILKKATEVEKMQH